MEVAGASEKIVSETKRLYSSLLQRPLDGQKLSKPSFKFILDLVLSQRETKPSLHSLRQKLISETKVLKELTGSLELEAKRRARTGWDRRAKVDFIQQLIDFVANNRQQVTRCVASKVVAGLEPNKTNELIQALGRIVSQRMQIVGPNTKEHARPRTFTKRTAPQQPEQVSRLDRNSASVTKELTAARETGEIQANLQPVDIGESEEVFLNSGRFVEAQKKVAIRDATFVVEPSVQDEEVQSDNRASLAVIPSRNLHLGEHETIEQARTRIKSLRAVIVSINQIEHSLSDCLQQIAERDP